MKIIQKDMQYLIGHKIFILNEKEYNPVLKNNIRCFQPLDYQNSFKWTIILNKACDAWAYFKYVVDSENKPKDYLMLDANQKYEQLTCYRIKDVIGKRITEIVCDKEDCAHELIKKFYRTAIKGDKQNFYLTSKLTGKKYSAFVYSPAQNFFMIIFKEIPQTGNILLDNCKIIALHLNEVSASEAVTIETINPFKLEKVKKIAMVSSEIARYLGIIKNNGLEKNTVVKGLNQRLLSKSEKNSIKKLESKNIKMLSRYEGTAQNTEGEIVYFMING